MKTSRILLLFTSVFFALVAGWWSSGQTAKHATAKEPADAYHNLALDQLTAFMAHLEATKQTNTLKLFNDYANSSLVQQHSADLGVVTAVLLRLRDGRTSEAIKMLEGRLDTEAVGLWASYNELPPDLRKRVSLTSLGYARDYCAKYPRKRPPEADEAIARAFALVGSAPHK